MRVTGIILCLASAAAFGAMGVFGKLAYEQGSTVATLLSTRFVVAALVLWLVLAATGGAGRLRTLSRRDMILALGLGAVGYGAQAGCYFAALDRMDASLLALVLYTFPVMVAVAAIVLKRDGPAPAPRSRCCSPGPAWRWCCSAPPRVRWSRRPHCSR